MSIQILPYILVLLCAIVSIGVVILIRRALALQAQDTPPVQTQDLYGAEARPLPEPPPVVDPYETPEVPVEVHELSDTELYALMERFRQEEEKRPKDDIERFVARHLRLVEDANPYALTTYDTLRIRVVIDTGSAYGGKPCELTLQERTSGSLQEYHKAVMTFVSSLLRNYLYEHGLRKRPINIRTPAWKRLVNRP